MSAALQPGNGFNAVSFSPSGEAAGAVQPGMTVPEALASLEQQRLGKDAIDLISQSLSPPKRTKWLLACAGRSADQTSPADQKALAAAQNAQTDPAAQAAAMQAAQESGFQGPGAFAVVATAPDNPAASHFASGTVLMSAAAENGSMPPVLDPASPINLEVAKQQAAALPAAPPQSDYYDELKPHIELGKQIAAEPEPADPSAQPPGGLEPPALT